ncbi:MAG: cation:proton antiporter [Gammaproteobacteria bacterium]
MASVAGVVCLGALCQWLAWRIRVPAILFLLLAGIVVGPVAGLLDPDVLYGPMLFPFVSLSVAIILFEGALTLRLSEITGHESVVRRMVTSGVVITWIVVTLAAHYLAGLDWALATLFGAIMVVTGPTVIAPMLRTVRPNSRVASVLRWEGIVVDPIGALLAVLVFEFMVSAGGGSALGRTMLTFGELLAVGTGFGVAGGYLLGVVLLRGWLAEFLRNITTFAFVVGTFAAADAVASESGLLAVTVMGIYLANRAPKSVDEILEFNESLSLLLISGLFIVLAARLDLAQLTSLGWIAVQMLLVVQFVARPLKVLFATRGSALSWRERALLAWIAPRGIIAAAISALFALQLQAQGYAGADRMVPLAFVVIIGTVVLQSLTAAPLARALGVSEPSPGGFLIVGANPVARAIAAALAARNVTVRLTDANWNDVRMARMAGLPCYYGNPLSEHAEAYLETAGMGRLLAATEDPHLNELVSERYRQEFGAGNVYTLKVAGSERSREFAGRSGTVAFSTDANHADMLRRIEGGAKVHATRLSEVFDMSRFKSVHGASAMPLFAIDTKGRPVIFAPGAEPNPGPGWWIVALVDSVAVPPSQAPGA